MRSCINPNNQPKKVFKIDNTLTQPQPHLRKSLSSIHLVPVGIYIRLWPGPCRRVHGADGIYTPVEVDIVSASGYLLVWGPVVWEYESGYPPK